MSTILSKDAIFSKDGKKRYRLTRFWESHGSNVGFVMLNPSVADAEKDDPTVRKCIGFASRWGFTGIVVTNLVPVIATDPYSLPPWAGLYHDNDSFIVRALKECAITVVAWGGVPNSVRRVIALPEHILHFRDLIAGTRLFCIGRTAKGAPLHPSRTTYTNLPQRWEWNS